MKRILMVFIACICLFGVISCGKNGADGHTPYIGENGNWFINGNDTGLKAESEPGTDGETPYIGENGNWWIGNKDTGVLADPKDDREITDGLTFTAQTVAGKAGFVVSGYEGNDKNIVIPNYVGKVPVIGVTSGVFYNKKYLIESIALSKNTVWLGRGAFSELSKLREINFNGCKLKEIPSYAFSGSSISSITLPNSVTKIADHAFYGSSISSITLPKSVTEIGDYAFSNLHKLISGLNIENITYFGSHSLDDCYFDYVYLSKNVKYVGEQAFNTPMVYLEHESYPTTWAKEIFPTDRHNNFQEFKKITNCQKNNKYIYSIRNNNATIYQYLGDSKKIELPSKIDGAIVNEIGFGFNSNYYLYDYMVFDNMLIKGGYTSNKFIKLNEVKIPNSVTQIEFGAFMCCPGVLVYVPQSVTLISQTLGCTSSVYPDGYAFPHIIFESSAFPTVKSNYIYSSDTISTENGYYNELTRTTLGCSYDNIICDEDNGLYFYKESNGYSVLSHIVNKSDENDFVLPATYKKENILSIRPNAFYKMNIPGKLVIGNNIKCIESKAVNCCDIGIVLIPNSVVTIKANAFCSDVMSYYVEPKHIPVNWDAMWAGSTNPNVKFNNNINSLGAYNGFVYLIENQKIQLLEYYYKLNNKHDTIIIPSKVDGLPVEKINKMCINVKVNLTIFIPSSVIYIEQNGIFNGGNNTVNVITDLYNQPLSWDLYWYYNNSSSNNTTGLSVEFGRYKMEGEVKQKGDYKYLEYEDHITLLNYLGTDSYVYIPKSINGKPVTTIYSNFYIGNDYDDFYIPKCVSKIESNAFENTYSHDFYFYFESASLPSNCDSDWYYNSYYGDTSHGKNIRYSHIFESPAL